MKYNVFIVDDEPMMRHSLASCVAWQQEGFELVGEASNGEAALQLMQHEEVHILITDIKMPLMDGLELTRQAKQLYPNINVILVTSFSDFEFAREAVKLGVVVDYLLKPTMEPADLLRILQTCRFKLEETAARNQEVFLYHKHDLENDFKKLIRGETVKFTTIQEWMKEPLIVAVWKQESHLESLESLLQLEKAREKLLQWLGDGIALIAGEQQLVTVAPYRMGSGQQQVGKLHQTLDKEGFIFTVGISVSVHRLKALSDAYRWAFQALEQAFFAGKGKIFMGGIRSSLNEGLNEEDLQAWAELKERFSNGYAVSNREESEKVLKQCFVMWEQKRLSEKEIVTQARSLVTIIWSRSKSLKTDEMMHGILDKLQNIVRIGTLQGVQHLVLKEFRDMWDNDKFSVVTVDSGSTHAIQLALSYIQENFRSELSLQGAADHVHMSRNYFSEQFKRVTGLNFIDFVIRLRLHHAMQLLRQTNLKVYDVGDQSGFNSSKHFLKLFKREVNCTPAEYRQQHGSKQ